MLMRTFGYFIFSCLSHLLQNSGSAPLVSKTARGSLTVFRLYLCISHFSQSLEKEAVTVVGYVNEQSAAAHIIPQQVSGDYPTAVLSKGNQLPHDTGDSAVSLL